jgi:hypothetical protein
MAKAENRDRIHVTTITGTTILIGTSLNNQITSIETFLATSSVRTTYITFLTEIGKAFKNQKNDNSDINIELHPKLTVFCTNHISTVGQDLTS